MEDVSINEGATFKGKARAQAGKERTDEGNYPSIRLALTPVREKVTFGINLPGYIELLKATYRAVIVLYRGHESATFDIGSFVAFGLGLLAKRVFQILVNRGRYGLNPSHELAMPPLPIPRTVYSYLSSIGDIYLSEFGVELWPSFDESSFYDLIANSLTYLNWDGEVTPRWRTTHREQFWGQWMSKLLTSLGQQSSPTDFPDQPALLRKLLPICGNAQNQAQALSATIWGWIDNPPIRADGTYQPLVANAYQGANVIATTINGIIQHWNLQFEFLQLVNRTANVHIPLSEGFCTCANKLQSFFRCAVGLPQTLNGSIAQLMYYDRSTNGTYFITSPVQAPPTYSAMAIACAFRASEFRIFPRITGFTSNLTSDPPDLVRTQWISSCFIQKK